MAVLLIINAAIILRKRNSVYSHCFLSEIMVYFLVAMFSSLRLAELFGPGLRGIHFENIMSDLYFVTLFQ